MKRTFQWVYKTLVLAVGILVFAACSSDNGDDPKPNKDFPTFSNISVVVGDTGSITFDAYATWTISSNKTWFKLAKETDQAGKQSVGYTVTDDGLGFLDDVATITFGMDGKSVSFTATRTADERSMKLYIRQTNNETGDLEVKEIEAIDLVFSDNSGIYTTNFAVIANYNWKLTVPAWIEIDQDDMSGDANPDATTDDLTFKWVSINYAGATADQMSGQFVFADQTAADQSFSYPVTAPGSKNYMFSTALFQVKMTAAGKYVINEEEKDAYTFTAIAGNEGITFFKVWRDAEGWYGVDPSGMGGNLQFDARWCGVDQMDVTTLGPAAKEFAYELWVQENTDISRMATIIGLPTAMAEGLTAQDLVDDRSVKAEYQRYIITELTQEGVAGGLQFQYGVPEGVTLEPMAAGDELDGIKSNFNVESVYVVTYNSFQAASMAIMEILGASGDELSAIYEPSDAQINEGAKTGWLEFSPYGGSNMTATITDEYTPFTTTREALVVLRIKDTTTNVIAIKIVQTAPRNTGVEE